MNLASYYYLMELSGYLLLQHIPHQTGYFLSVLLGLSNMSNRSNHILKDVTTLRERTWLLLVCFFSPIPLSPSCYVCTFCLVRFIYCCPKSNSTWVVIPGFPPYFPGSLLILRHRLVLNNSWISQYYELKPAFTFKPTMQCAPEPTVIERIDFHF